MNLLFLVQFMTKKCHILYNLSNSINCGPQSCCSRNIFSSQWYHVVNLSFRLLYYEMFKPKFLFSSVFVKFQYDCDLWKISVCLHSQYDQRWELLFLAGTRFQITGTKLVKRKISRRFAQRTLRVSSLIRPITLVVKVE